MTKLEAWASGRPIYNRMPKLLGAYANDASDQFTRFWDKTLIDGKDAVLSLPTLFDPVNCPPEWLDYLAPLVGLIDPYWSEGWPDSAKRKLISGSLLILWAKKGTIECLDYVIDAFDILHKIQIPGDFIISGPYAEPIIIGSKIGDKLGRPIWEYNILLPTEYENKPQYALVELIIKLFGPCWCKANIILTDEPFYTVYISLEGDEVLSTDDNEIILAT